ncbi:hypothetical protein QBC35DRAFT_232248 [Podospora australis]|uniref:Uncharacterized protein n=1 Tax=Podospora australis TaxID=1536484 RepID=A0AAN7AI74_9PEZI|nr:hypothetical protein QBC35DRAFT_232248 [Podospora australis]
MLRSTYKDSSSFFLRLLIDTWSLGQRDSFESPVCHHVRVETIPELRRSGSGWGCSPDFRQTAGEVRSCSVCFTDYQIRVATEPLPQNPGIFTRKKGERWFIEISLWNDLGECRHPFDPKWATRSFTVPQGPVRGDDKSASIGSVQRAWMEHSLGSTT